ncbi:MAG: NAD(P)-binding domain-containing protein [Bacteroidota bacterium]|nr:NAD(P)-binding domain-containing protein [Bacteroidota bacterium]
MKNCNISVGFIGGGRITRIILQALKQKGIQCKEIKVYDPDGSQAEKLKSFNSEVSTVHSASDAAKSDMLFMAVHPPELKNVLKEINQEIETNTVLVSLAPKIKIQTITEMLGKDCPVIRMIPNAPSIINKGYNVIAYSNSIQFEENEVHQQVIKLLEALGDLVHVDKEDKLEAYAVITGMGPTYLWFQLHELYEIAKEFGMSDGEARNAISKMVKGSVETLLESELDFDEVMDLIPFQPLSQHHGSIKELYRNILTNMHNKLK